MELAALTPAHLNAPPLWQPNPGTDINPEALFAVTPKPVISNASMAKAGLVSSIAEAVGNLPSTLQTNYWQGYNQAKARAAVNDPNASVTYNSDGSLTVRKPTDLEQQLGAANLGILTTEGQQKLYGLQQTKNILGLSDSGAPAVDPTLPANPSAGGLGLTADPSTALPASGLSDATGASDFGTATEQQDAQGGLAGVSAAATPTASTSGLSAVGAPPRDIAKEMADWVPQPADIPREERIPNGKITRNPQTGQQIVQTVDGNGVAHVSEPMPIPDLLKIPKFYPQQAPDGSQHSAADAVDRWAKASGRTVTKSQLNQDGSISVLGVEERPKLPSELQKQLSYANAKGAGIITKDKNPDDIQAEVSAFFNKTGLLNKDQLTAAEQISKSYETGQEYKDAESINRLYNNFRTTYNSSEKNGPGDITLTDTFSKIMSNPTGRLSPATVNLTKNTVPLLQKFLSPDGSVNTDYIQSHFKNGAFLPQETRDAMNRVVTAATNDTEKSFVTGSHFQRYAKLAEKAGLDPKDWINSPFTHQGDATQSPQASAPAAPSQRTIPLIDPSDPNKTVQYLTPEQAVIAKQRGAISPP